MENLILADKNASNGKMNQPLVISHLNRKDKELRDLQEILAKKLFKTSVYTTFTIFEPKERLIFRLPFYPDRIIHHAIMNILEPIFVATFTADTYSCIKGKGIHAAAANLKKTLKDLPRTKYCLKFDIIKFYPTIDHEILKALLRRKFKDQDLLDILDEIIDSAPGLPIGNYLSQYFANFYLSYFDHWVKEKLSIKYYFRYADDIVILASNKQTLHAWLFEIRNYLSEQLRLEIKENYQIFPVESRGIDYLGYVFFNDHILLRKSIKQNFARMLKNNPNQKSIASYNGWLKYCNSYNLKCKLLNETI